VGISKYCGLGGVVVGSEGFLKILSPHSPVDSAGFVPMSIVPTVQVFLKNTSYHIHVAEQKKSVFSEIPYLRP